MSESSNTLPDILKHSPVRVVFESGALGRLGELARQEDASRVLLVSDPGIVAAGHVEQAVESLSRAGLKTALFTGVAENPTTQHVAAGLAVAREHAADFIVGLGGGSVMDCAKGVNLLLTNGGRIADYRAATVRERVRGWGQDKTINPMLPMIMVPTTAGTGSEAQSFALISDPDTRQKMVCGDRRLPGDGGLRPRVALLDPDLTRTQPAGVVAASGMDAVAHAVETAASTKRNDVSRQFSREAFQRLSGAYETVIRDLRDRPAREHMLLGAHLAGAAIEHSMLGAAHACANPLTARCGLVHGVAVGLMLPHVVRFNAAQGENPYADLCDSAEVLARRIESLLDAGGHPRRLIDGNVPESMLPELAALAAKQWTATFNPRPVGEAELLAIYRSAWT